MLTVQQRIGVDTATWTIVKREVSMAYQGFAKTITHGDWMPAEDVVLLQDGLSAPTLYAPRNGRIRVLWQRQAWIPSDEDKALRSAVEEELRDEAKLRRALAAAYLCVPGKAATEEADDRV